jgi:hypothetical protein
MREKHSAVAPSFPSAASSERHYSVAEVATMWNLSPDAVRKIFENEPGVFVWGGQSSSHARRYRTLRIPQSVLERVHRRLSNV